MSRRAGYAELQWWLATACRQRAKILSAQAPVKTLTMTTGRGELLEFTQDVKQVAAAEPKIADVVVISPREVMVNAKEPGKTTVVVWENGTPIRYNVDVVTPTTRISITSASRWWSSCRAARSRSRARATPSC